MKNELQNIISGKSQVRHGNSIQTVSRYLRKSQSTGRTLKSGKQIKSEETFISDDLTGENLFNPVMDKQTITEDLFEQE